MRVQLFVTCIVDTVMPQIGEATVTVLERLGHAVEFPAGQTCCGQPGYNAGYRAEARQVAQHFLDVFSPIEGYIVTPSGSCAAMVLHGMPDLFRDDSDNLESAREVAARTYELSQFLVRVLGVTDIGARYDGILTYHPSCHLLYGLDEKDAPLQLLEYVRDADVVPLPDGEQCCGFGGLFAVKMASVSNEMLTRKVDNIRRSKASACVTCDAGCLLNMDGKLRQQPGPRALHLAEVLAAR